MRIQRQNLIGNILIISLWFAVCFLFSAFAVGAQTKAKDFSREQFLNEAAVALDAGNFKRAAALLQKIIAAEPRNLNAQTLAGIAADRQNDLAAAAKHFAAAAQIAANSADARNNYGAILLRLNKKTEAAREFAAALKINPNQSSALVNLAQIRFSENDFAEARKLFGRAQTIAPDAEILKSLTTISLVLNETERARREFDEYFTAAHHVGDAAFAKSLFDKNLDGAAQKELESIAAANPQDAATLRLLSQVYLKQKNVPAAGKLLETAVARGADDARIYTALADVYQAANRPENAIPAMRLAIEKEPNAEAHRVQYGLLLIESKAPAAAVIRIEEAIKTFPKSARLRLLLGTAQYELRKSNEAQTAFESALAIDPQLVPALGYLAIIYGEQGKFDDAVKIYERTLRGDEKNALMHYLLADTLLRMQDAPRERIEGELRRAVALDTNLALAHSALGRFYVRQTRWTEARAALERAVALEPTMADALYQLGLVYARLKLNEQSKATLARFKELNVSQEKQKEADRREIVKRLADTKF